MKRFRTILAALTALMIGGCGGDSIQSPDFTQVLLDLAVSPQNQNVPQGRTQQYTALARYSLPPGSNPASETRPIENVTWSSSDTTRVTIDSATGLATVLPNAPIGQVTIRATAEDAEGTATLNVVGAVVDSLIITLEGQTTPAPDQIIPVDAGIRFQARATLSNGQSSLTSVNWTATNSPVVLTIDAGPANSTEAVARAQGVSVITATSVEDPRLTDTVQVNVRPFIQSVNIAPDPASTPLGRPLQFTATGRLKFSATDIRDGQPILSGLQWSVANNPPTQGGSPATVATINPDSGLAVGQRVGTATVTAVATSTIEGGQSDTAALTITPPVIDRLEIAGPDAVCLNFGIPLTAEAVLTNNQRTVQLVQWSATPAGILSFDPTTGGMTTATGVTAGTATVSALAVDLNGSPVLDPDGQQLTDTATVNVVTTGAACDLSNLPLVIRPLDATVRVNGTRTFRAGVLNASGDLITQPATFASSNTAVATFANPNNGVARGEAIGATTITATRTANGATASTTLRVTNDVCTTPFLASQGAIPRTDRDPIACALCSVDDPINVIDGVPGTFATLNVPLALLGGNVSVGAELPPAAAPFAGGDNAGFVIARPVGTLVLAEVLSQIQVSTVLNGVRQEISTGPILPTNPLIPLPLRVDLLGLAVNGEYDLALVTVKPTAPYDGIDLSFNSGVATALSNVLVFDACAAAELPQANDLVAVERIEPLTSTLAIGASRDYVLLGRYSDNSIAPIPDADVVWDSSSDATATVAPNGLVTGVAAGNASITAELSEDVPVEVTQRTATASVTVIPNVCTEPLLASDTPAATITSDTFGIPVLGCLFCSSGTPSNVIDDQPATFGTLTAPVGLLNSGISLTVAANQTLAPATPNAAGFIVSRPSGLLLAELLSSIQVQTLNNGVVQNSSGGVIPLRLDLLGVDLLGADQALVSVPTTGSFDAIRLVFNSGLLSANLGNNATINVFRACSSVTVPTLPAP
ncbi:MAG: Ig-like domain-containing protein [Panacagrimonas sp.]